MRTLEQKLNGKSAKDIKWGLKMPAPGLKTALKSEPTGFIETFEHYQYIKTEPDNQRVGCCDMETWMGTIASIYITMFTGEAHHMDVERAYWKALKDYHNTSEDQGLAPQDGAQFLVDNDILQLTWAPSTDLWKDLKETPLAIYQYATDAMMPQNLSPVIGQESEDYVDDAGVMLMLCGGHARALVGATIHNDVEIGIIRGSWGKIGYGLDCLTCGTLSYLQRTFIVPPDKPRVTDLGSKWRDWILD